MRNDQDPTKITLQTNIKQDRDPTIQRMIGIARHGNTPFDVPFISNIEGNLWQGGCHNGLQLPHFIKHVVSLYPWETYQIKHDLESYMSVKMYDSLDQSMEQIEAIAQWVNVCVKDAPTLLHCQAGLNRSSLVAARALMLEGRTADAAIKLLRDNRSPAVLCNQSFENYLRSLDEN
jgi:protein-tyrosine phosphatase